MLKSLKDRPARFARAGKIKLGIKVMGKGRDGQPVEIPKDVEYFVLPEELRKVYGDKPTLLPCRLPYDDPAQVFDASFQRWQGADLTVRCDEQICWARDHENGKVTETPCRKKPGENECACLAKPMGRLLLLVPGGHVGVYEIRLSGYGRIATLWEQIQQFREIFGRLRNVPFFITREARDSTYRDKHGKAHTREIHPVHLKCEWSTLEQFAQGHQLAPAPVMEALPAAAPEADDAPEADGSGEIETAVITSPEPAEKPSLPGRGATVPEELPYSKATTPVVPAVASGEVVEAALGPQHETQNPRTDWDPSMCVAEAVKVLGIPAPIYDKYLDAVYGGPDCMDSQMVWEQQDLLQKAKRDPKVAQSLKRAVEAGAKGRLSTRR